MKEFFKKALSSLEKYFAVILSVFSLIIAVLALIFSFADIKVQDLQFKPDHFLAVIGAIMSSIGFVLGIYFALLAVKAYGDIREIENQVTTIKSYKETVENQASEIQRYKENIENKVTEIDNIKRSLEKSLKKAEDNNNSINSILNSHTANYIKAINSQIDLYNILADALVAKNPKHKSRLSQFNNRQEELTRQRARTSYEFPHFEDNREGRFAELNEFGDKTDLPFLQEITKSENETERIKEIAQAVINNIIEKLK